MRITTCSELVTPRALAVWYYRRAYTALTAMSYGIARSLCVDLKGASWHKMDRRGKKVQMEGMNTWRRDKGKR